MLTVRVEIEADAESGFDEGKVRTVSENATVLKFEQSSFEVERVQRLFEARWLRRQETMEGQADFLAQWKPSVAGKRPRSISIR